MGKKRSESEQEDSLKETKDKQERETQQLFDLLFKFLLENASNRALVGFINGLFNKNYPVDSNVTFGATESVSLKNEKLTRRTSDKILTVAGDSFVIEAQISDDESIGVRILQYALSFAFQNTESKIEDVNTENLIILRNRLKLGSGCILYWEHTSKTPDIVIEEIENDVGSVLEYKIKTIKVLEQSPEILSKRNMMLLFPFCLVRFRKELKKTSTTQERRRELAGQMEELLDKIEYLVEESRTQGHLSNGDAHLILKRLAQMYNELYKSYSEFEEVYMRLEERLRKTKFDIEREEAEKKAKKEASKEIISLWKQGYTVEQVEAMVERGSKSEQVRDNKQIL